MIHLEKNLTLKPCPHATLEEFQNAATITSHFGSAVEETLGSEITLLSRRHLFRQASTLKRKAGVFKFLHFEERLRKASFS